MTQEEIDILNSELRCLESDLKYHAVYGDYKITKCKEYELSGLDCPYTQEILEDYHVQRDVWRKRIKEIRELLEAEQHE
jgi:hypothetical protein